MQVKKQRRWLRVHFCSLFLLLPGKSTPQVWPLAASHFPRCRPKSTSGDPFSWSSTVPLWQFPCAVHVFYHISSSGPFPPCHFWLLLYQHLFPRAEAWEGVKVSDLGDGLHKGREMGLAFATVPYYLSYCFGPRETWDSWVDHHSSAFPRLAWVGFSLTPTLYHDIAWSAQNVCSFHQLRPLIPNSLEGLAFGFWQEGLMPIRSA